MTNHSRLSPHDAERVDALVDGAFGDRDKAVLAHPALRGVSARYRSVLPFPSARHQDDDLDDMWDNVPV